MKQQEVKKGDLFRLGDHRLMCGDSTDPDNIERLIGEKGKVRTILTDPPYGVAYVENKAHFKNGAEEVQISVPKKIANDHLQSDEEYAAFTRGWLEAVKPHLESYNTAYIFNSDLMLCALRAGMQQSGWYYSQMIIWVKQSGVIGRKDYMPQHELAVYGWMGRHKMEHPKGKSVIFHPRPTASKIHPTQKPVGLLRKFILDATKKDEIVFDPFGGSGSTLIACEHTQRRCRMIEMDEDYCSKIIARWELLTGKKAEKIS